MFDILVWLAGVGVLRVYSIYSWIVLAIPEGFVVPERSALVPLVVLASVHQMGMIEILNSPACSKDLGAVERIRRRGALNVAETSWMIVGLQRLVFAWTSRLCRCCHGRDDQPTFCGNKV